MNIALTRLVLFLLSCLAAMGCSGEHQPGSVDVVEIAGARISAARIRAVAPGQDKTAAYFTIENVGQTALVLTRARSPDARAVEFHNIEREGDIVRMRHLGQVVVQPGATVEFAPGGLHLMVFGISETFETFSATLSTDDDREIELSFRKIPLGGAS